MNEPIIVDGQQFHCGLQLPAARPATFARLSSAVTLPSREEIIALLNDPNRTPARTLFPGKTFTKNQYQRSSCNGYAGAKCLERARIKRGLPHVALSGEYLYATINGGRDNGSMLDDGMQQLMSGGTCREELVPNGEYLLSRISAAAKADAARFTAFECYNADSELELAAGIALGFVGVVAVQVGGDYTRIDAAGIRGSSHGGPGNHAVGVQDAAYRDQFIFDEFGSWGLSNGQDGYAWITWQRHLQYTVRNHAFYLIRAASDDPLGDNPQI